MNKFLILCGAIGMMSFTTPEHLRTETTADLGRCFVTITYTNIMTGESYKESYYSDARTSQADCEQGARDLANGNFMGSSDFRRSPQLFH